VAVTITGAHVGSGVYVGGCVYVGHGVTVWQKQSVIVGSGIGVALSDTPE